MHCTEGKWEEEGGKKKTMHHCRIYSLTFSLLIFSSEGGSVSRQREREQCQMNGIWLQRDVNKQPDSPFDSDPHGTDGA